MQKKNNEDSEDSEDELSDLVIDTNHSEISIKPEEDDISRSTFLRGGGEGF